MSIRRERWLAIVASQAADPVGICEVLDWLPPCRLGGPIGAIVCSGNGHGGPAALRVFRPEMDDEHASFAPGGLGNPSEGSPFDWGFIRESDLITEEMRAEIRRFQRRRTKLIREDQKLWRAGQR